jgi:hypothetical protein
MTHSCTEHGHYCHICHEEALIAERKQFVKERVEMWMWNNDIFEIYDETRDLDDEEKEELLQAAADVVTDEASKNQLSNLAFHFGVMIIIPEGAKT